MKKLLTSLLLMIAIGLIIGAVASMVAKKRLEGMTDDEIRAYLATKLEGKVGEEQLATIQEATVAGVRKSARRSASKGDAVDFEPEEFDSVAEEVESVEGSA